MKVYATGEMTRRSQAYRLLALAARETWGWDALPPMERGEHGKPFFPRERERQFNLSHSGSFALCGLDRCPLGVDIQVVKTWRPGLCRRVCSPEELEWLGEGPQLWRRFTLLWTLKECAGKRTGEGIFRSLPTLSIPLPPWEEGESPLPGERLLEREGIWFRIYGGEGWYASVCGESPPPEEILWREIPCCRQDRGEAAGQFPS